MAWFHAQRLWNEMLLKKISQYSPPSNYFPTETNSTVWSNTYNLKRKHLLIVFFIAAGGIAPKDASFCHTTFHFWTSVLLGKKQALAQLARAQGSSGAEGRGKKREVGTHCAVSRGIPLVGMHLWECISFPRNRSAFRRVLPWARARTEAYLSTWIFSADMQPTKAQELAGALFCCFWNIYFFFLSKSYKLTI